MEAYILDSNFNTLCEISQFESFIWTVRYSEYGDFEIIAPAYDTDIAFYSKIGNFIIKKGSDRIMVIDKVVITDSAENGATITISGKSAEALLDRRVVWGFTALNGNLQNGIKKLMNENVITPSIQARKLPHIIFRDSTDPKITSLTHSGLYEGENLYDTIVAICETYGIGFRIVFENDQLIFELYNGVDRSYSQTVNPWVVFSPEYDNLSESTYLESDSATKTTAFILANGDGPNPYRFTTYYDKIEGLHLTSDSENQTSGMNRREMTVETSVGNEYYDDEELPLDYQKYLMQSKGMEELAGTYQESAMFDGVILPTSQYELNKDYFIGDVVQVSNKFHMEMRCRVVEIIESSSSSGNSIIPTFTTLEDLEDT